MCNFWSFSEQSSGWFEPHRDPHRTGGLFLNRPCSRGCLTLVGRRSVLLVNVLPCATLLILSLKTHGINSKQFIDFHKENLCFHIKIFQNFFCIFFIVMLKLWVIANIKLILSWRICKMINTEILYYQDANCMV